MVARYIGLMFKGISIQSMIAWKINIAVADAECADARRLNRAQSEKVDYETK